MRYGTSEDVIRIRVLPQEATEVAEWAGLMLSELVGEEAGEEGTPVRLRDPERAAELLELLMLCAEEGADASSALEPAIRLCEAAGQGVKEPGVAGPEMSSRPGETERRSAKMPVSMSANGSGTDKRQDGGKERIGTPYPPPIGWHPYYGSGAPDFADREEESAYRSDEERADVLMAVRFGASALIDLARSHGMDVPPGGKRAAGGSPGRRPRR